ncbi:hypothetical protein ABFS82_06G139700 [Erythranthe guttata]
MVSWNSVNLKMIYNVLGWIAFVCWSINFHTQVVLNFRRKSVAGLNLDYAVLGFVKQLAYLANHNRVRRITKVIHFVVNASSTNSESLRSNISWNFKFYCPAIFHGFVIRQITINSPINFPDVMDLLRRRNPTILQSMNN